MGGWEGEMQSVGVKSNLHSSMLLQGCINLGFCPLHEAIGVQECSKGMGPIGGQDTLECVCLESDRPYGLEGRF